MRRRTRRTRRHALAAVAAGTLAVASLSLALGGCGGRPDDGSPIPTEATTTTPSVPSG